MTICNAAATSNSVTVVQFFNHVCKVFFDDLIWSDTEQIEILEQVANHYDVIETNSQEMLHLHVLIWLARNLEFNNLQDQLLQDDVFAHRMICYLKFIIVQNINFDIDSTANSANTSFSSKNQDLNHEFHERLAVNSNTVAVKTQIHFFNHTVICFKYHQKDVEKNVCRFNMSQHLCSQSEVDELDVIHLSWNNSWMNSWNSAIATCICFNHDISWISIVIKFLCLIYYLTNYVTKNDVSLYQMLLKTVLLKQSIKKAKFNSASDATDLWTEWFFICQYYQ